MKIKHTTVLWLLLFTTVINSLFVFDAFGLDIDRRILLIVSSIIAIISLGERLSTTHDLDLESFPEIRWYSFIIGMVACIPCAQCIIHKEGIVGWIVAGLLILLVNLALGSSEAVGNMMASSQERCQPRH